MKHKINNHKLVEIEYEENKEEILDCTKEIEEFINELIDY